MKHDCLYSGRPASFYETSHHSCAYAHIAVPFEHYAVLYVRRAWYISVFAFVRIDHSYYNTVITSQLYVIGDVDDITPYLLGSEIRIIYPESEPEIAYLFVSLYLVGQLRHRGEIGFGKSSEIAASHELVCDHGSVQRIEILRDDVLRLVF